MANNRCNKCNHEFETDLTYKICPVCQKPQGWFAYHFGTNFFISTLIGIITVGIAAYQLSLAKVEVDTIKELREDFEQRITELKISFSRTKPIYVTIPWGDFQSGDNGCSYQDYEKSENKCVTRAQQACVNKEFLKLKYEVHEHYKVEYPEYIKQELFQFITGHPVAHNVHIIGISCIPNVRSLIGSVGSQ